MEQTTPKIITDTSLSKHHFNSDDFDIYEDNGTYILVAKVKLPKVKKLELSGEEVNKKIKK
jgi:hypothetical protein